METARGEGKARLLVIEDNPADVELLRRALADAGLDCQLTVVDDGADALALFRPGSNPGSTPRNGSCNRRFEFAEARRDGDYRADARQSEVCATAGGDPQLFVGAARSRHDRSFSGETLYREAVRPGRVYENRLANQRTAGSARAAVTEMTGSLINKTQAWVSRPA